MLSLITDLQISHAHCSSFRAKTLSVFLCTNTSHKFMSRLTSRSGSSLKTSHMRSDWWSVVWCFRNMFLTSGRSFEYVYVSTNCTLRVVLFRGRPFDSEGGGGGLAILVGTYYLFSSRAWPENLFPGKPRTECLFSTAKFFWKSKTKIRKKREGVSAGV